MRITPRQVLAPSASQLQVKVEAHFCFPSQPYFNQPPKLSPYPFLTASSAIRFHVTLSEYEDNKSPTSGNLSSD